MASFASLAPSMLKRIGALPVQLTVTVAHNGSRFGALAGAALRLLDGVLVLGVLFAALFGAAAGVAALAASTVGALLIVEGASGAAFTVAVIVLETRT